MLKLSIINGPNLNLLGQRSPEIYGASSLEELTDALKNNFPTIDLQFYQSNVEGELINELHRAEQQVKGIILNAGGYTHTSVAIADAVQAISCPVLEVHISNILAREPFRHQSLIAPHAIGTISGFGIKGYEMAIHYFLKYHEKQ